MLSEENSQVFEGLLRNRCIRDSAAKIFEILMVVSCSDSDLHVR
jgi:hypothetical protein